MSATTQGAALVVQAPSSSAHHLGRDKVAKYFEPRNAETMERNLQ